MDLENGKQNRTGIFQGISIKIQLKTWKEHQSSSREIRWNLILVVVRPKAQKGEMAGTGRGSEMNRMKW